MNSTAEAFGRLIGLGISILLPLVFIILNVISIRRRSVNALCVLALIATLLGMMLLSLSGLGAQTTHVPSGLIQGLAIAGGVLMLISSVLAVIGLVRCLMRRRYTRGRWRAVIALGLNAIFLTFLTINTLEAVDHGVAWNKLFQPTSGAGSPVINEAWNFRIQPPPEWSPIDPAVFGPQIRAAFSRSGPEMYALILSEDLPDGVDAPLAGAMEALKETLRAGGQVEFLAEEDAEDRQFIARTLETRSHETGEKLFHVYWMVCEGVTLYRIAIWGSDSHANRVRDEAKRIISGFELIDPKRILPKATPKPTVAALGAPANPHLNQASGRAGKVLSMRRPTPGWRTGVL